MPDVDVASPCRAAAESSATPVNRLVEASVQTHDDGGPRAVHDQSVAMPIHTLQAKRIMPRGVSGLLAAAVLGAWLGAPSPAARAANSQRPARDPFLAQLAGRWQLRGTVLGKPVRYHGSAVWILNDGWLRLGLVDRAKPPAYQADVYLGFDAKAGDYIAHWLDQFGASGARVVATGYRDGRTLVLIFPYDGAPFRDTLTLSEDGESGQLLLESQNPDGAWSTFATYVMTRIGTR